MKPIIYLLLFMLPAAVSGQEKGIQFRHFESWDQVLTQAKKEQKFIFVDVYTTWCVPCKMMSMEIFPREDVGTFMNKNFISIKVQMDSSKSDPPGIKQWYADAAKIKALYNIRNYPTLLYFDPAGNQVHRTVGQSGADEFIQNSADALDSNTQYLTMLKKANSGENLSPDFLKALTIGAWKASEREKSKFYARQYLSLVDDQQLLSEEGINFVTIHTERTTDPGFQFFLRNKQKIDSIKGEGTAFSTINWYMSKDVEDLVSINPTRPDWTKIYKDIKGRFPHYADELIIKRKIKYYTDRRDWAKVDRNVYLLIPEYGRMLTANELNGYAYNVFLNCNEVSYLKNALQWTSIMRSKEKDHSILFTRASLLYKLGRAKEAIGIIEQIIASSADQDLSGMEELLKMMQNGKKTWIEN
ncbi:thioredoxin family protein [Pedobacter rhizosphaerae]|uniref:Thioredoxin domain-containing protein n=1 Tax=Pedobacter rhizosphaerae TaxID=390241 RepID=A0A1H9SUA6_9SPHI|nr:DUF255 domain-containing protein [Pedobacter rhizosphaerae]SER87919.1 Protein of unknown function, DUF255 [Pedobacter rhizosphaerae]